VVRSATHFLTLSTSSIFNSRLLNTTLLCSSWSYFLFQFSRDLQMKKRLNCKILVQKMNTSASKYLSVLLYSALNPQPSEFTSHPTSARLIKTITSTNMLLSERWVGGIVSQFCAHRHRTYRRLLHHSFRHLSLQTLSQCIPREVGSSRLNIYE